MHELYPEHYKVIILYVYSFPHAPHLLRVNAISSIASSCLQLDCNKIHSFPHYQLNEIFHTILFTIPRKSSFVEY